MEMLLNFIVGLMISCANAVLVRKLEGRVYLPMVSGNSCGSSSCPLPLGRGTRANLLQEKVMMKCSWKESVPYSLNHVEPVVGGRLREFSDSQTSCDRFANGTYTCTPQLGYYCYAYVSLGFRTRSCNTVSIKAPLPYRLKTVNGAETLQIYSLANNLPSWVKFEIECDDGLPCLDDNLIVMSLLYRCPDN